MCSVQAVSGSVVLALATIRPPEAFRPTTTAISCKAPGQTAKSTILNLVRCHPIEMIQGFGRALNTSRKLLDRRFLVRGLVR
jgi:hypothetical protein